MFRIVLTETFSKELKKLETGLRERIKQKLQTSEQEPFRYFERLQGHELFKLRIGKYRIVAQISVAKQEVLLLSLGHRKNVYDKL